VLSNCHLSYFQSKQGGGLKTNIQSHPNFCMCSHIIKPTSPPSTMLDECNPIQPSKRSTLQTPHPSIWRDGHFAPKRKQTALDFSVFVESIKTASGTRSKTLHTPNYLLHYFWTLIHYNTYIQTLSSYLDTWDSRPKGSERISVCWSWNRKFGECLPHSLPWPSLHKVPYCI